MKATLSSHMAQMARDGRVMDERIYGVQPKKKGKSKRDSGQGMSEDETESDAKNAMQGNASQPVKKNYGHKQGTLIAGKPKTVAPKLGKPKSAFAKAFEAAKKTVGSIHVSTDSRARLAGKKPTKSPSVSTRGAGVD